MGLYGYEPGQLPPESISTPPDMVPFWAPGSVPDAYESPSQWDIFYIGGDPLPGLARVRGARQIKVDQRNAPGTEGSTLTFLGRTSAEIQVTLRMWTNEQLDVWNKMVPKIQPPPGKLPPEPLDVYHPALAMLAMKSLLCLDAGIMQPSGDPGVFETQLRFIEFLPEMKAPVKTAEASGAIGSSKSKLTSGQPQSFPPSKAEHKP